jgi:hypothetical protein
MTVAVPVGWIMKIQFLARTEIFLFVPCPNYTWGQACLLSPVYQDVLFKGMQQLKHEA